jgi:hypothetical protein
VLSLACAGGYLAVVELLLGHGAKPDHILKVKCSLESLIFQNDLSGRALNTEKNSTGKSLSLFLRTNNRINNLANMVN